MAAPTWPSQLWIIRHGQSAGNVARDAAELAKLAVIDIPDRDVDVALSSLGERQARALGHWLGDIAREQRPQVILSSPYMRAIQTGEIMLDAAGLSKQDVRFVLDERLREKEFGILDRLTRLGIQQKYPELDAQRQHVGKFYFRPPGGESWCDVILRLRAVTDTLSRDHAGQRVMLIGHQVIVNCFRYLLEELSEAQILGIDRMGDVPNCGVTSYRLQVDADGQQRMVLDTANFVQPLLEEGAPITVQPDVSVAAKS